MRCRLTGAASRSEHGVGVDALVGRQQRHPGLFKLVLNLGVEVHAAGEAFHRFADDGDEASIGALCFGELRRKCRELEQTIEVLKAATTFFARECDPLRR